MQLTSRPVVVPPPHHKLLVRYLKKTFTPLNMGFNLWPGFYLFISFKVARVSSPALWTRPKYFPQAGETFRPSGRPQWPGPEWKPGPSAAGGGTKGWLSEKSIRERVRRLRLTHLCIGCGDVLELVGSRGSPPGWGRPGRGPLGRSGTFPSGWTYKWAAGRRCWREQQTCCSRRRSGTWEKHNGWDVAFRVKSLTVPHGRTFLVQEASTFTRDFVKVLRFVFEWLSGWTPTMPLTELQASAWECVRRLRKLQSADLSFIQLGFGLVGGLGRGHPIGGGQDHSLRELCKKKQQIRHS